MRDATRRNRNFGTSKQGRGQNNKFVIPTPLILMKHFSERLVNYIKVTKTINGQLFLFIIEKTRRTSAHACTINDIENILNHIPQKDLFGLKFIIFRQPKRKEELLSPVWGRLIYSYDFENESHPAIIIEAVDYQKKLKLNKSLSIEWQKRFAQLINDGHRFTDCGKYFIADYELKNVRNTQLYTTVLHEIGHYVEYLQHVALPGTEDEDYSIWEKRFEIYLNIPKIEQEKFADQYAKELRKDLTSKRIIPFDQITDH